MMMDWLGIAVLSYFLYALNNVNVRGIISRYLGNGRNYLLMFALVWTFFLASFMVVFNVSFPGFGLLLLLVLNGIVTACSLYFLFVAVSREEVTRVAVLLGLSPVFTWILSFCFLGESLSGQAVIGVFLLVLAGILASFSRDVLGNWRVSPALVYGILASLFMAISNVIFKFVTFSISPVDALVWGRLTLIPITFAILMKKSWRVDFVRVFKSLPLGGFTLVLLNEAIALVGTLLFIYSIAISSATLVSAMGAVYPVFTFLVGIAYTFLNPEFVREDLSSWAIATKLASLVFLVPGILLVSG